MATKSQFICALCDKSERDCHCEKYCAFCQSFENVRLCGDGLYYCQACREACDYRVQD